MKRARMTVVASWLTMLVSFAVGFGLLVGVLFVLKQAATLLLAIVQ